MTYKFPTASIFILIVLISAARRCGALPSRMPLGVAPTLTKKLGDLQSADTTAAGGHHPGDSTKDRFHGHEWGYEAHDGPDTWTGTCSSGIRQSPVDVRSADVDYALINKMHFANYIRSGQVKVTNNGHTVMISGFENWNTERPYIYGGGLDGMYHLTQIHFHWGKENNEGSEHTFNSLHFPVEVHLVHIKDGITNMSMMPDDAFAVLGVFLTISKEGSTMAGMEGALKELVKYKSEITINDYQARPFLPHNIDNFYRYEGSLTTPKCNEAVIWTLFPEPLPITQHQLNLFRNIGSEESSSFSYGNFRNTQPLNGRRIQYRSAVDRRHLCAEQLGSATTRIQLGLSTMLAVVLFALTK